ncbi:MAG: tetratricopeptide repeat protein, partial [Bacteroidota bacterium]
CYEKLEMMDEARTYYKKAVKLAPQMSQGWYGIALTLEFEERWYESIHYIRKALEYDDHNSDYWVLLGDCEYKLNNIAEAEECYKKALDHEPENLDAWLAFSIYFEEENRMEEAIHITAEAMKFHPECSELYYRIVCLHYLDGRPKEAYTQLEIALAKDYSYHKALFEMLPELKYDSTILQIIEQRKL